MGCHSAKFTNEKGAAKVRDAILKYDVRHPVVNDDKMLIWRNFERSSWPSLLICNPRGVPILILGGEGHRKTLDLFLTCASQYYKNKINYEPTIPFALEERNPDIQKEIVKRQEELNAINQNLKFPGKVLCIEK